MARRSAVRPGNKTKTIACPCGARYSVAGSVQGMVACKRCGTSFSAGFDRGTTDNRVAVRAMVIGAIVIAVMAAVFLGLGNKKVPSGTQPSNDEPPVRANFELGKRNEDARSRQATETSGTSTERGTSEATSNSATRAATRGSESLTTAVAALQAIAGHDRVGFEKVFLFEAYFRLVAERFKWTEAQRYETMDEAARSLARDFVVEQHFDSETSGWIQRALLPALDSGAAKPSRSSGDATNASFEFEIKDASGGKTVDLRVSLLPRPESDVSAGLGAWGVAQVATRWHTLAVGISEIDKGFEDMAYGRQWRETKRSERRNPGGFAQADPAQIPTNAALSPDLVQTIEKLVRTAVDPNETVKSVQARDELERVGVPTIPFLLNELVGIDHLADEEAIKRSIVVIEVLRRLTGKNFGYGPPAAADPLSGEVSGATPEQRVAAVRGWFGWWNASGRTFTGRNDAPEKEEDDPRRKPRKLR